jgi:hypothetical protein
MNRFEASIETFFSAVSISAALVPPRRHSAMNSATPV